ncbi:hypothetical protein [Streptomyces sp. ST2-7A]|uniref:hypothetical protein n=1 Tax=Streptomyces sp. ST2-7A TaxID=2907214 RepID=UPI001F3A9E88|nr:hypothetical protein [Streptomyces sp. ST2-7A]MCE7078841.1 hypothetical protein [Streptomyces sp. ST2-7A]
MKSFIGRHEVRDHHDYLELSLGTDPDLWLGVEGESASERAARLDAGLDILADDPDLAPAVVAVITEAIAHRPGPLAALPAPVGGVR